MATIDYAKALGEKIHDARIEAGMTLRALASDADMSASYLCEIEAGESVPAADKLQRIAKALKMPISRLLPAA